MRVAITADPFIPVPPLLYGGIERIIHLLVEGLVHLGHDVTLIAHKNSHTSGKLVSYSSAGNDRIAVLKNSWTVNKHLSLHKYDLIHSFGRLAYLIPQLPRKTPKLMSYQREPTISQVKTANKIAAKGSLKFTGCSNYITAQLEPYCDAKTIYNGVNITRYTYTATVAEDAPLVFLGRIEHIKGAHLAIRIAQQTGKKLIIAGNIPPEAQHYFDNQVKPHLTNRIEYVGPVNDFQKNNLLGKALALLMPIEWNEPFGIVMVEAMACGTPVIGFGKGALPEIVTNECTGFYSNELLDLVDAVAKVNQLDRHRIRKEVEQRFSAEVIVNNYLELYQEMINR